MTARPSLRVVLLVPVLATLLAGFAALAVFVDRIEWRNRLADVDAELVRAELTLLQTPPGRGDDPGGPRAGLPDDATLVALGVEPPLRLRVDPSGRVVPLSDDISRLPPDRIAALIAEVDPGTSRSSTVGELRVRVTSGTDGVTITGLSLVTVREGMADFRRALILGAVAIAAVVATVTTIATTLITRPVARLAATAGRIADGDLTTEIHVGAGAAEIGDLGDDLGRMVARLTDMIERSELAAADAEAARDEVRRVLADLSHEIRTPLTALKGYSDLHRAGMLDDDQRGRAMDRIGAESERLARLAADMLELARTGRSEADFAAMDVGRVVDAVADDLRAAHPERPITAVVASALPETRGDVDRFHQAVLNLGANACVHTDADVPVELRARRDGDELVVAVVDHGRGLPAEGRAALFDAFARPEASRARSRGGGAGLGLAVAKAVAELHRGGVRALDTPGGGATFEIRMPVVPPV